MKDFLRGFPYVFVAMVGLCIFTYLDVCATNYFGLWWMLGFWTVVLLIAISTLVGKFVRRKESERPGEPK